MRIINRYVLEINVLGNMKLLSSFPLRFSRYIIQLAAKQQKKSSSWTCQIVIIVLRMCSQYEGARARDFDIAYFTTTEEFPAGKHPVSEVVCGASIPTVCDSQISTVIVYVS